MAPSKQQSSELKSSPEGLASPVRSGSLPSSARTVFRRLGIAGSERSAAGARVQRAHFLALARHLSLSATCFITRSLVLEGSPGWRRGLDYLQAWPGKWSSKKSMWACRGRLVRVARVYIKDAGISCWPRPRAGATEEM